MPARLAARLLALMAIALLVACSNTPSGPAETDAPDAPAATQPDGDDGDGGGAAEDFCLNTTDEVGAALEVEVTQATSTANEGFGGGCTYYDSDNALVYALAVITGQGTADDTVEAGRQTEGAIEISGIGDEAVLVSPVGPLVVRVGDTLISQGPTSTELPISDDDDAVREAMENLARAAVGRLP